MENAEHSGAVKKKKIKFNHHPNLSNKIMCLLVGRTGCGKTYLMFKILTTPGFLDFDNLIIFTTTSEQPIYQFLKHGFSNNLKKEAIFKLFQLYEESEEELDISEMCIEAAKNKELVSKQNEVQILLTDTLAELSNPSKLPKDKKSCIIFDDCINHKDQSVQKTYFTRGRHANCSCFYLTQSFYGLDGKYIRKNANIFILFELNGRNVSELLKDIAVDREQFKEISRQAWHDDFGYITINLDKKPIERVINDLFTTEGEHGKAAYGQSS